MKNLPRLLVVLSMLGLLPTGPAQGAEVLAASALAPIIIPIAKDVLKEVGKGTKAAVIALSKKKNRCKACNSAFTCKMKHAFSVCKSQCTEVRQVGGYELRIRFGEGWSLAECVKKGVGAGHQTARGKGNVKSIAIYSQEDLDYIQGLIAMSMVAHKIADTDGKSITRDELESMEMTREEAVDEANETINTITAAIVKGLKSGRFGNQ